MSYCYFTAFLLTILTFTSASSCGTTTDFKRALSPDAHQTPPGDGLERFADGKRYAGYLFPIEPPYQRGAEASVVMRITKSDGKNYHCSGFIESFHGGDQITAKIVTNHHCFSLRDPDSRGDDGLILPADPKVGLTYHDLDEPPMERGLCDTTIVWLGGHHTVISQDEYASRCVGGSLRSNRSMDIAVFDVLVNLQGLKHLPAPLPISSRPAPAAGEKVYTVNYVAPHGFPVQHLTKDCRVGRPFYRFILRPSEFYTNHLLKGTYGDLLSSSFSHNCPLSPGASGSALVSEETGEVVGLNWGGAIITDTSGKRQRDAALSSACIRYFLHGFDADRAHCSLIQ